MIKVGIGNRKVNVIESLKIRIRKHKINSYLGPIPNTFVPSISFTRRYPLEREKYYYYSLLTQPPSRPLALYKISLKRL